MMPLSGLQGSAIYYDDSIPGAMTIEATSFWSNTGAAETIYNTGTIQWTCQPGHYQRQNGHYLAEEGYTNFTQCSLSPCGKGFYSNATDLTQQKQCTPCSRGHYCDLEGTSNPEPCPPGSAFPNVQATDRRSCFLCFPGQYQDQPGQETCSACVQGSYSAEQNASACDDCPGVCPEDLHSTPVPAPTPLLSC